jgi:predicted nucleic acid-binding protein
MIVVSDTTAITSLLQINQCDLLAKLYGEVVIPAAVRDELLAAHPSLPEFLSVRTVRQQADVQLLRADIDIGEAEAIVLAKELAADLLLVDETEGRRVALLEGVNIIGLLGVLVQAKRKGLLFSVRDTTAKLESVAEFRVADDVKEIIFRAAGE